MGKQNFSMDVLAPGECRLESKEPQVPASGNIEAMEMWVSAVKATNAHLPRFVINDPPSAVPPYAEIVRPRLPF